MYILIDAMIEKVAQLDLFASAATTTPQLIIFVTFLTHNTTQNVTNDIRDMVATFAPKSSSPN